MGSIHFSGLGLFDSLIDLIGYKCGVAISRAELVDLLRELNLDRYADMSEQSYVRIHSSEYEELYRALMVRFGRIEEDTPRFPAIALWHKVKHNERLVEMYYGIHELYKDWFWEEIERAKKAGDKFLDPRPLLSKAIEQYGKEGLEMADYLLRAQNAEVLTSPWSEMREVEWRNQIQLQELFNSEGLNSAYGKFFDQRYIDYLHQNFDKIDSINWRKFEHLTGEYLSREGFHVVLGPGRGDDGVDVRAWPIDQASGKPQIIVQCKRQRDPVPKVTIKALYADVVHEGATSGLLVTTSRISPGAEDTRTARAYPISVADRPQLRKWLSQLRTPGVGGFDFST